MLLSDESGLLIARDGDVPLRMKHGEVRTLNQVLHAPQMTKNLVSVRHISKEWSVKTECHENSCNIVDTHSGVTIMTAQIHSYLYLLDCSSAAGHTSDSVQVAAKASPEDPVFLWHCCLDHLSLKRMQLILNGGMYREKPKFKLSGDLLCEACELSKSKRRNPKNSDPVQATELLSLVHTDLCGPMSTPLLGGARFFMAITDDWTRFTVIHFLRHKSEVFGKFVDYVAYA